jgi:hypothetical protein
LFALFQVFIILDGALHSQSWRILLMSQTQREVQGNNASTPLGDSDATRESTLAIGNTGAGPDSVNPAQPQPNLDGMSNTSAST